MPVGVDCDLNRAVSHLLFYVGKGRSPLNQQASEGMAQVVESKSPEASVLYGWQEVALDKVVWVKH